MPCLSPSFRARACGASSYDGWLPRWTSAPSPRDSHEPVGPDMSMQVATYARVSTSDQVDTGTSLADQERRLLAAVTARDGRHVGHFVDAGVSGASDSRPGLDRLRDAVRSGGIDCVMATKIDRVSRSAVGLLALIEDLRSHSCHLMLIDEGLDTSTSAGDLTSGLLGVIGGWERKRIADRTKGGRRAAAELEGRFVASVPPFGYRIVPAPNAKGKRLAVDEDAAYTVRRMYELLVRENASSLDAARALNEENCLTSTGMTWTPESVSRWALREEPLRAASGLWIFDGIPVDIPPILASGEVAYWRTWQDQRRRPGGTLVRGPYLLSGILKMPCGRGAMGRTAGTQRPTYSCRRHYLRRETPGRHDDCYNIPCGPVEETVIDRVSEVLRNPEVLGAAIRERLGLEAAESDYDELVDRLRAVEVAIASEAALFRSQGYSGSTLAAVLAPLHTERQELARAVSHAQTRLAAHGSERPDLDCLIRSAETGLSNASLATWRQVFMALELTVNVDGYETCSDCGGSGYLPLESGRGGLGQRPAHSA